MAQGEVKKGVKQAATGKGGKAGGKAKAKQQGGGAVKKSNRGKTTADKVQKKFTSGMCARTEEMLGAKAGHLELIGKGRKKGEKSELKGGSRKFG